MAADASEPAWRGEHEPGWAIEDPDRRLAILEGLLAGAPEHFYALDLEGRLLFASQRGEELAGRAPDEIGHETLAALGLPEDAVHAFQEAFETAVANRGPVSREIVLDTPHGRRIFEYTLTTVPPGAAEPEMVACTAHDITGLTEKLEAATHQETVLQEAQAVAHIGSWEWHIPTDEVTWTRELYRIFGQDPDTFEATFEGYMSCIHPEDAEEVQAIIEEGYQTGEPFVFEHRIVRPDGEVGYLHCRGQVILDPDGEPVRMVGTAQDITERHAAEQKLRAYAEDLEQANLELERFAYVASHDLQEPLRMINSYIQLLERSLEGELDEDQRVYMGYVTEGVSRMQTLIRDLLAYSRVDRGLLSYQAVDLQELLDEVLADLTPAIQHSGATIDHDPLPTLTADPTQMRLVLQHLVANAIKFHEEGAPSVRIRVEETDDGWHLTVADDGIGFDPAYQDTIFVMFKRLHGPSQFPGTGMGLSICKKIVERHGGEIWAESEPGQGSIFHIWLPEDPAEQGPQGRPSRPYSMTGPDRLDGG